MARRRSSDDGGDGCAWFLLLVIASVVIGHINGAGVGWLVFFAVIFFEAIS
jgi:hypothetical protein